jgi:hypothetical protein
MMIIVTFNGSEELICEIEEFGAALDKWMNIRVRGVFRSKSATKRWPTFS